MPRPNIGLDPRVRDAVPAPDGYDCQMWNPDAEGWERCGDNANVLFVYEEGLSPETSNPKNAFACENCAPDLTP